MNNFDKLPPILIPYLKDILDTHGFANMCRFNTNNKWKNNSYGLKQLGWKDFPVPIEHIFTKDKFMLFSTDNIEVPFMWIIIPKNLYQNNSVNCFPSIYFGTWDLLLMHRSKEWICKEIKSQIKL
jgi:hypothetical protein